MSTYIRLTDYKDSDSKEQEFFKSENRYEAKQDDFKKIPGSPIAYWVSKKTINVFKNNNTLGENIAEVIKCKISIILFIHLHSYAEND